VPGDSNTLYHCVGHTMTDSQACAHGCQSMPGNLDDRCGSGAGANACSGMDDGYYCGNDGVTGDPTMLYHCVGQALSDWQVCANGCAPQPGNTDDRCN
jgi:hypothetical protein